VQIDFAPRGKNFRIVDTTPMGKKKGEPKLTLFHLPTKTT